MKKNLLTLLSLTSLSLATCVLSHADSMEISPGGPRETFRFPENRNQGLFLGGYVDSGLVIGRVSNFESRGYLFKSWEFSFNFGDIGDNDSYNTVPYQYSTLDYDMFYRAEALDQEKPYVLKYEKSIIHNPFSRETSFNIVDAYPTYIGKNPAEAGLPLSFVERNQPNGGYSTGRISGRIIKVQRWGRFQTACAVTVHMKGTKNVTRYRYETSYVDQYNPTTGRWDLIQQGRQVPYNVTVMNTSKLKINSEEGCSYAEKILIFGKTIDVSFSESFTGIFDYSRVVKSIQIK